MYGNAHGLAYILDPRFLGQGLPVASRRNIEEILIHTPADDDADITDSKMEALYVQFTDFHIQAKRDKDENTFRFKILSKKRKSPLQYWLTDGADWPELQKIALKIFRLTTSSAASERNFSTFGFIHSKLRNSPSTKSVENLVYIKTNMGTFYDAAVMEAGSESNTDSQS